MQLQIDMHDVEKLRRDLERFRDDAFPYAIRATLNNSAFATRSIYQAEARSSMTLRNKYTTRSIRVDKARGLSVRGMEAVVGSTAEYMRFQEEGVVHRKRGKHGVAIPTRAASGEARGSTPRQRLVRKPNKLANIALLRRARAGTRQQRNVASITQAKAAGRKYVFLDLGRRKGIFRMTGGSRKKRAKLTMLWDLSRPATVVKRNPMLQRSLTKVEPHVPRIHKKALLAQLRHHGILGYGG